MSSDSLDQSKKRAVLHTAGINRLPWRLVAHCFSFLDTKSLSRAQSASRNLRSLPLDGLWRARYLLEFEEESMDDACIATDGEQTCWQKRFSNRAGVDTNRRQLRFSTRTASWPMQEQLEEVLAVTASLIA